jgi:heterodisulfide reductase subunit C
MAIDMSAVMDALRQIAIENGILPAQPRVLDFHREVLASIERYGRTHKLEIMLRFKARTGDWFSDLDVGLKMLAKRKLDLTPSRVKAIADIRQLFQQSRKEWPYG